jgi:capsular polysaccharide biosynthesis protein
MSEAVATRTVAEPVIQSLNMKKSPKALLENLSAQAISETQFIEITYTDTDPGRTQRVANAVGDEFSRKVSDISPNVSGITATVWERAGLPGKPVSPDPVRNGLIGAMLGIILGWSLAFLLEFLDDTWQSVTELEQATGLPTLSVVPAFGLAQGKKLVRRSR